MTCNGKGFTIAVVQRTLNASGSPTLVTFLITRAQAPVCTDVAGGASSIYPCKCGATTAATTVCASGELCTASTDSDGVCQVRSHVNAIMFINCLRKRSKRTKAVADGGQGWAY